MKCMASMDIPIVKDSVFPGINSLCPSCNQGMFVVTNIEGTMPISTRIANTVSREIQIPQTFNPNTNDVLDNGGNQIFTAFQNRISPLILVLQLIDEFKDSEGKIHVEELCERFSLASSELRNHLQTLELDLNVKRGQRLSDGFPTPNQEGAYLIVLRNIIGTDGKKVSLGQGLVQTLQLVKVDGENMFELTKNASIFTELESVKNYFLSKKSLKFISKDPMLPEYYDTALAEKIVHGVFQLSPDQKAWALHIIQQIAQADKSNEIGWDSNTYAFEQTALAAMGQSHPRWFQNPERTLYEKFIDQGIRQKKASPENHARDRLEKHINGKLGSLLSFLKELGIAHPIRIGNTKNYAITVRGMALLTKSMEELL